MKATRSVPPAGDQTQRRLDGNAGRFVVVKLLLWVEAANKVNESPGASWLAPTLVTVNVTPQASGWPCLVHKELNAAIAADYG